MLVYAELYVIQVYVAEWRELKRPKYRVYGISF